MVWFVRMAGASYGRLQLGYVGVEVGRIRSSRMLAAVTRVSSQVHLACVENSNRNRPLVSECSINATYSYDSGRQVSSVAMP